MEILHIPGCPHVELLRQRLTQALAEQAEKVEPIDRVITDLASARTWRMTGSPTLLVDGVDPFAEPGLEPSESCRLYRGEAGDLQGAPTVAALRTALGLAESGRDTNIRE
ncbi:MAG TPA: hypothetical protein VGN81_37160 [Pseudonocardiaceae bacterium]